MMILTRMRILILGAVGLWAFLVSSGYAQIRVMEGKPAAQRPGTTEQTLIERARRLEERGDSQNALEAWRAALSQNAWNAYAIDGVRRNLVYLKKYEEAIEFTEGIIARAQTRGSAEMGANDPLSPFALTLGLGEIYLAQGESDRAWEIWNRALVSESENPSAIAQLVRVLQRNRLWEQAESIISDFRKKSKQPAFMALEMAQSLQMRMAWGAATSELITYLMEAPTTWEIAQQYLARFPDDSMVHREVKATLARAVQEQKRALNLRRLFAGYLFKSSDFAASYDQIVVIDSMADAHGEEILSLAAKLLREENISLASQAFSRVLSRDPALSTRLKAELGLADCLLQLQKYAEAKAAYETFVQAHPQAPEADEARFHIAAITLRHERHPDEALKLLQAIEKGSKALPAARIQLNIGDCLVWMNQIPEAIEVWRKVTSGREKGAEEFGAEATLRIARAYFWLDSLTHAGDVLDSMMEGDLASRCFNDAMQYSNLLLEGGQSGALRAFAQGDLLLFQEEPDKAAEQFERVADLARRGRMAEWGRYLQALSLRKAGEPLTAAQVLEKFIVDFPQSRDLDQAIYLLAQVQEEDLHDEAAARVNYEKILTNLPESTYLEQARKRARALTKVL
jgi:outer membrane protein assembly factor BamD (BamD/ComL family)